MTILAIGARQLVLAPFAGKVDRGVVGVARLYDERFDGKSPCSRRSRKASAMRWNAFASGGARRPLCPRACCATRSRGAGAGCSGARLRRRRRLSRRRERDSSALEPGR